MFHVLKVRFKLLQPFSPEATSCQIAARDDIERSFQRGLEHSTVWRSRTCKVLGFASVCTKPFLLHVLFVSVVACAESLSSLPAKNRGEAKRRCHGQGQRGLGAENKCLPLATRYECFIVLIVTLFQT